MPVTTRSTHRAPDRLTYPPTQTRHRITKRTKKSPQNTTKKTPKKTSPLPNPNPNPKPKALPTPTPKPTSTEPTVENSKRILADLRAHKARAREAIRKMTQVPKPRAQKTEVVQYKVQTAVMVAPSSSSSLLVSEKKVVRSEEK